MSAGTELRERMRRTLRETFGFTRLRTGQRRVIESVLDGRDTLAIMPTGAGKSLCYQLPALHLPGITLVVSPLISLMKDQADKLNEAGVDAAQLNSSLPGREVEAAMADIRSRKSEIVFATPERLADPEFIAALKRGSIDLFVVDEAHCISQWGHDFRPAFLEIAHAIKTLGDPPVLALTATATEAVIEDIGLQLGRPGMRVINTGIYRANLRYSVVQAVNEGDKRRRLMELIDQIDGPAIVYCATVKSAEEVVEQVRALGHDAALYHGRLPAAERRESQERFMSGATRLMIATNAFGMGIDKSDIRHVIHYQLPSCLEAYYQESGRAGRDRLPAHCTLIFDQTDRRVQQFFLARRYPTAEHMSALYEALEDLGARRAALPFSRLRSALNQIAATKLQVALKLLVDEGLVQPERGRHYRLQGKEAGSGKLAAIAEKYKAKAEADQEKLERMVFYAQSAHCRWKVLLEYFGEEVEWSHCGSCDNCLNPPAARLSPVRAQIKPAPQPPKELLARGDVVRLPRFGEGQVVAVNDEQVEVSFPDGNTRSFMRNFVQRV